MPSLVSNAEDRELIEELKKRGYKVAKADRIRIASSQQIVHVSDLVHYGKEHGYKEAVYHRLGADLGVFLMHAGAVPVHEEVHSEMQRLFRATVTVVVENPQFDWPYPLTMMK